MAHPGYENCRALAGRRSTDAEGQGPLEVGSGLRLNGVAKTPHSEAVEPGALAVHAASQTDVVMVNGAVEMKKKPFVSVTLVALGLSTGAMAADAPVKMPLKAPVNPPYYDWTGFYVGAHGGYATGYSKWSGTERGTPFPTLSGSLDFFHAFDGFKGTGSYFVGLQAGYNYMLPSRVVLGAEADVTFPSNISGLQVISSPATGTASYAEQVQYSGTVRSRVGYAPSHWLVYVTGGFAWTANQFTRTQIDGRPVDGSAAPGDEDRRISSSRASAARSAPAWRWRCHRAGRPDSNISTPITDRAAFIFRLGRSASTRA